MSDQRIDRMPEQSNERLTVLLASVNPTAMGEYHAAFCHEAAKRLRDLEEEKKFWRRDAAARLFGYLATRKVAAACGDTKTCEAQDLFYIKPTLAAIDEADAKEWHPACGACGKPILQGQLVRRYDDVGDVHADCGDEKVPAFVHDDGDEHDAQIIAECRKLFVIPLEQPDDQQ